MTVTIYGIKNCDTMKKARSWLDGHGVAYGFHDYRVDGLAPERLASWQAQLGWEELVNRSSATWRQLPDDQKAGIDGERAAALMLANPTLIKRPVLEVDGRLSVGFKPESYGMLFPGA